MKLIISEVTVKQDKEGRYCLNDLHKSAGSQRSNDPHDWLRLKQTKELIEELTDTGIPVTTINTVFISMGWDFEQRKSALMGLFDKKHRQPLIEEQHRLAA